MNYLEEIQQKLNESDDIAKQIRELQEEKAEVEQCNLDLEKKIEEIEEKKRLNYNIQQYEEQLNKEKNSEKNIIALITMFIALGTTLTPLTWTPLFAITFITSVLVLKKNTKKMMLRAMKDNFRFYSEEMLTEIFGENEKGKPIFNEKENANRIFNKKEIEEAKKLVDSSDLYNDETDMSLKIDRNEMDIEDIKLVIKDLIPLRENIKRDILTMMKNIPSPGAGVEDTNEKETTLEQKGVTLAKKKVPGK